MAFSQFLVLLSITFVLCVNGQFSITTTRNLASIDRRLEAIEQMFLSMNESRDDDRPIRTAIHSCPVDFYNHESTFSCYRLMSDVKSWYDARADCQTQGADLVWFDSMVEYRHVVIKLLTDITDTKDYNNAGYWTGANDITDGGFVWGDTADRVSSFFYSQSTVAPPRRSYNLYPYNRQTTPSPISTSQKHCIFMKYMRAQMQIAQDVSECDGGRLYICKCKTDRSDDSGCSKPTVSGTSTKTN